jgi:hypothetical protein
MKTTLSLSFPAALVAVFLLWPALLSADVVELRGGSRLVGKITRIDGGNVVLATDFAGTVTLKQAEVTAITTDAPVAVRFANGTRVDGVVSSPGTGRLRVANAEGEFTSDVGKVAASWAAGGKDPAVAALERSRSLAAAAARAVAVPHGTPYRHPISLLLHLCSLRKRRRYDIHATR